MNETLKHLTRMLLIAVCIVSGPSLAATFEEGTDYLVLPTQDTELSGQIVEFFAYSCPYCFRSQVSVESAMHRLSGRANLDRVAVTLGNKDRISYANTHLLLRHFKLEDEWHQFIFHVAQAPVPSEMKDYDKLWIMENVKKYFLDNGISADDFDAAIGAIDSQNLVQANDKLAGKFRVTATPTFIVNGKYFVQGIPDGPGGQQRLADLLVYLSTKSEEKGLQ